MRTIVIFALLALSVSAFDFPSYVQGFTQQFNFTQAQDQDLSTCFIGFSQILKTINADIQAHDLNSVILTVQGLKEQLAGICGALGNDIFEYAWEHGNGQTPKQIFNQYGPEIIQQVATWANYLAAGRDFEAGEKEAYILQILMGAQQPATLPVPQYDWSKYQQLNQDVFIQQYLGAFFNTLGLAQEVDIPSILTCVTTMEGVFQGMEQFHQAFATGDFDGKLDAIQGGLDSLIQGLKSCQAALHADVLLLVPIVEAFKQDPVRFILEVVNNVALNFPELIQNVQQEQVDVYEGDYADAGILKAQRMQAIFNGVVNF
jgi:hypothetical protein